MAKTVGWIWLGGTVMLAWATGGLGPLIAGTALCVGAGYATKVALDKVDRDNDRKLERKCQ